MSASAEPPRAEYPRPQFVRPKWLCLNGRWQCEVDRDDFGLWRSLLERELKRQIVVPFCPELDLSGVNEQPMEVAWYRRRARVPVEWVGRRLLLHVQAVDHDATVWADRGEVARHRGGWTPFTADLGLTTASELTGVVRARDPSSGSQARGKQLPDYAQATTGIWQTVWLEPVPETFMLRPRITPDVSESAFHVELGLRAPAKGLVVRARLSDAEGDVAVAESCAEPDLSARIVTPIPAGRRRLWSPADPFLYDLQLELVDAVDGAVVDNARSFAEPRSMINGKAILLNGEAVFQRLVLDQGLYPDGVLTAPSQEALVRDIELSLAAGFNGACPHQKGCEERFLYHCDRFGYLVRTEFPSVGVGTAEPDSGELSPTVTIVTQWLEQLESDYSHPSIIRWCVINEAAQTVGDQITTLDDVTRAMFLAANASDQTRSVLDASGWSHRVRETDVYDACSYEQDPNKLAAMMAGLASGAPYQNHPPEGTEAGIRNHLSVEEALQRALLQFREIDESSILLTTTRPGGTQTTPTTETRGGTAAVPVRSTSSMTGSQNRSRSCAATRTFSAGATRSSPTRTTSRTASTASTSARSTTSNGSQPRRPARPR
jgi:beta-galactosidase/beta-glucuronidase